MNIPNRSLRKALLSCDESELIALIQDEFDKLHEKLGLARGLTKLEIVNQIMDFVISDVAEYNHLIDLAKIRWPDFLVESAKLSSDDSSIDDLQQSVSLCDWGDALPPSSFFGRTDEISRLEKSIIEDHCSLMLVLGFGGVGKSSLSFALTNKIKNEFSFVFWRDLRNAPPLDIILDDLIKFLSRQKDIELLQSVDAKISRFLEYFNAEQCLIVLDNAESILQGGENVGFFRDGYDDYGRLIKRIGSMYSKSSLILTSREKPLEIVQLEGKDKPTRTEFVSGLDAISAIGLLKERDIFGTDPECKQLSALYGYHPLALKIVSGYIEEWFEGSIEKFLSSKMVVFGDIEKLLEKQIELLSDELREILYWLAIEKGPTSLEQLEREAMSRLEIRGKTENSSLAQHHELVIPISKEKVIHGLESLRRKSLIEKNESGFALQPVIMEYVTSQLIDIIFREIVANSPKLLFTHSLILAQAKDYILQSQIRLTLQPIVQKLITSYGKSEVEQKLLSMISQIRNRGLQQSGYAGGNIINLLVQLGSDLSGLDFSMIAIRQANLKSTSLHNVNFSFSDLKNTTFAETFDLILVVAINPDSRLLAAGSASGDIIIWDLIENRQKLLLHGHTNWTRALAFSPDGKIIASGSGDRTIRLWDLKTGECLRVLKGHTDWVRGLTFTPDGNFLVSSSSDTNILLWSIATGDIVKTFAGHTDWVWCVDVDIQGQLIASASNDKTVRVWDIETHETQVFLHDDWVRSVAFNWDGSLLASGGNDKIVRIWDLKTNSLLRVLTGHSDRVWCVAFSPDRRLLASGSFDGTIRLWDVETGEPVKTLQGHTGWVISVAFSEDGTVLVSGSEDQTVRLWDVKLGECIRTFVGHTNCIQSISMHPTEQYVASAGTDRIVRVWNIESEECTAEFIGHSNRIQSVAFSPNGNYVASGGDDLTIKIWDTRLSKLHLTCRGHTSWITSVAISPDNALVASGCDDFTVRLWDIKSGENTKTISGPNLYNTKLVFHPSNHSLLVMARIDNIIWMYDLKTDKTIHSLAGHTLRINAVVFSKDGNLLVSCSDDNSVILWDPGSGQIIWKQIGHEAPVKTVAIDPLNQMIASGGDDNIIKIWDVSKGVCNHTLFGHSSKVWSIIFSNDGTWMASGSDDETIRVWDTRSWECIKIIRNKKIYDGLNIYNIVGLTEVQKMNLRLLGAIEKP